MAVFQCKMCGGDLHLTAGSTVAQCEFCGVRQTVPLLDNDKKAALFARANQLWSECDFDKAAVVFESIVADFPQEAEAYWGLLLCEYGIEYVNDPGTGKKQPTCHRATYESLLSEGDYIRVLECADAAAAELYREEAERIEGIRKEILSLATREEPYDIFICYKEKDGNGQRTLDSVLAQELYKDLTAEGYRVFFSRISLEQKLGYQYEPYIFAALNTAKVMLVVGTEPSYFQSVWVKNEWSRFLKLMSADRSKHMIPCYKNMNPYEMPREFAILQGQDLGKIGAVQDILWGIKKLIAPKEESMPRQEQIVAKDSRQNKKEPVKISTVLLTVLLCFLSIVVVGSTGNGMEESAMPLVRRCVISLISMHLIIPLQMLAAGLLLRKKCTPRDAGVVCVGTIVLCVMMGIVTTTTLQELWEYFVFGYSINAVFGVVAAVLQVVVYKLSKMLFYRICGLSAPSKS